MAMHTLTSFHFSRAMLVRGAEGSDAVPLSWSEKGSTPPWQLRQRGSWVKTGTSLVKASMDF